MNGLEGAYTCEGFAEFSDFFAERVVILSAEVFDDGDEDLIVAWNDVQCERPESGREGKF